jgi:hypothetical protein
VKKPEQLLSLTDIYYELKGMPSGGISMPSLLKYKKEHLKPGGLLEKHARGKGSRNIRFTKNAIVVFMKIKRDGVARRGRPRKEVA